MATQDNTRDDLNVNGWRAVAKRWRRDNRRRLNRWLTRMFGTTRPRQQPLAPDTHRILVVRRNKRLGNILFLTPMLRTLAEALPGASIDVFIKDPRHQSLLESLPGVRHVFTGHGSLWATLKRLRRIRQEHYDLVIDPSGNSTSNRTAVAVCGARQRMGFASDDQWLRLTHASVKPDTPHQAKQAVALVIGSVSGLTFESFRNLSVCPDKTAQTAARRYWKQTLSSTPRRPVIGFFIEATGNKKLPVDWWLAWREQLGEIAAHATLLQICPPGDTQAIAPGIASIAIAPLDELAAFLSRLDVFVAADSGPMHLAAAAGTPVVGLFKSTSVASYAPLGRACVSLTGEQLTPESAARAAAGNTAMHQAPEVA